jgi:hypothetical protein
VVVFVQLLASVTNIVYVPTPNPLKLPAVLCVIGQVIPTGAVIPYTLVPVPPVAVIDIVPSHPGEQEGLLITGTVNDNTIGSVIVIMFEH